MAQWGDGAGLNLGFRGFFSAARSGVSRFSFAKAPDEWAPADC